MAKQLDADLKKLLTKQDAQEALTAMQASAAEFARQAGSLNEVFFQLQGADREYEALPNRDPERYEEAAFEYGADGTEEDHHLRVNLDYGGDLVRDAVRLGRAVEQMTDDAPTRDGTTMPAYIDSKRRRKLRQKKTALGHAEDDHEEMRMDTM